MFQNRFQVEGRLKSSTPYESIMEYPMLHVEIRVENHRSWEGMVLSVDKTILVNLGISRDPRARETPGCG